MIPCQECGNVNPLGTLFCHRCGAQLDLHLSQLQDSVNQTAADKRSEAVYTAGKNAANLTVFLLITTFVYRFFLLPGHLDPGFPVLRPMGLKDIFKAGSDFSSQEGTAPAQGGKEPLKAPPSKLMTADGKHIDLLKWRAHEKEVLLGDLDVTATGNCLVRIRNQQDQTTRLWKTGSDDLVATGLALLAFQAYPLPFPEIKKALATGLDAVEKKALDSSNDDSPGRVLCLLALLESGRLDEPRRVGDRNKAIRICTSQSSTPKWCAFAQMSIRPDRRLKSLAILRNKFKADTLWKYLLDPFSDKPVLNQADKEGMRDIFTEEYAKNLDTLDRIAWTNAGWRLGVNLPLQQRLLTTWSKATASAKAPDDLAALAGAELAADALAVLANTAPLRAPAPWLMRYEDWVDYRENVIKLPFK